MTNGISGIGAAGAAAAVNAADDEIEVLEEAVNKADEGDEEAREVMDKTGMTKEELKARIAELEDLREANLAKMEKVEEQIEKYQQKAVDEIVEAGKLKEKAVAEYEEDAREALTKCINDYTNANKKEPGSMTRGALAKNIEKSMPNSPNLAKALAKYVEANHALDVVDDLLINLDALNKDTEFIELELVKLKEMEPVEDTPAPAPSSGSGCCDPIGFAQGDIRYDFVVDDGNFDNASDFLGSSNGWDAVTALDTISKDGKVTADELSANNIKMVKTYTDANGNKVQELVDPSKEFESLEIDLSSYKEGGSHSAVDTDADFDKDGVQDQNLLGTFDIKINGQSVSGYNTLDDVDYLNEEYGLKAADGEEATANENGRSDELQAHFNFFTEYTQKSAEARADIEEGLAEIGMDEATIDLIKQSTKREAANEAEQIMQGINADAAKAEAAEEAEEAEAEEAEETENLERKGMTKEELDARIAELEEEAKEKGETGEKTIIKANRFN